MNADRTAAIALQVDGVSKRFGDTVAVDHVTFDLSGRELLALVGPSGCGKSTLLRMLAGLHSTESGSITLGGTVVDDGRHAVPPERRRVGLVFQEHALFPHLSVADNVGFGVRDGTARERAAEMLGMVGLARYGERYPHELSGGERQRVALARALAPRPALMLLDEPFASLDPNLRARVRDDVVRILRESATPAVFVTHDQGEALAVGDRIAVMRGGRIVQIGAPEDVFHAPSSRFVAAFMGEADFVRRPDAGPLADERWPDDDDALVMVRPDDVTFTVTVDGSAGNARVTATEFRGSVWNYELTLESGATVHAIRSHLEHVATGTEVTAVIRPGHLPVAVSDDDDGA
jgi:iron(III) transport system ATP-binding protein